MLEDLGVLVGREVAVLLAGRGVGEDDAVDQLAQAALAGVGADGAAEVLRRDDRRGVDRPEVGVLDAALLEDGLAGLPVGLDDVAALPGHLVVGVHAGRRVDALDRQAARGRPAGFASWCVVEAFAVSLMCVPLSVVVCVVSNVVFAVV